MAMLRWTVEIAIDETWIVDGFRVTPEAIQEAILDYNLPYASDYEVRVKVLKSPAQEEFNTVEENAILADGE